MNNNIGCREWEIAEYSNKSKMLNYKHIQFSKLLIFKTTLWSLSTIWKRKKYKTKPMSIWVK